MSIAVIKDNTVTYPTDVYLKYNIYLIEEYEKFLKNTRNERVISAVKRIIGELRYLIEINTSNDIKDIFNVMDWEEHLLHFYEILDVSLKYRKGSPTLTIETFLRKEKLERLNNISQ